MTTVSPTTASLVQQQPDNSGASDVDAACYRVRDAFLRELGSVRSVCAEASVVLAALLRAQGYDALVVAGIYRWPHDTAWDSYHCHPHAHVRVYHRLLDPTRQQFHEGPLTMDYRDVVDRYLFGEQCWPHGLRPPHIPTPEAARQWLHSSRLSQRPGGAGAPALDRILESLGLGDLRSLDVATLG